MRNLSFALIVALAPAPSFGGEVPFGDPRWTLEGDTAAIVSVDGREALRLLNGRATLDVEFENGIIEYDLMVTPKRGYHGVDFRVLAGGNAERFYIRPHQSGNPDANQYTPTFHGVDGWQLYYGPQFGAPTVYRFGEWIHHKIVVSGDQADVYIDSDAPTLHVAHLKNKSRSGGLRLFSGYATAHFANFRYEEREHPEIVGTNVPVPSPQPGTIATWEVSSTFDEQSLSTVTTLSEDHLGDLSWQTLDTEDRGYANLARVARLGPRSDTVFARTVIAAADPVVRPVEFGYSDRVRVYLNGNLIYAGNNDYRSRDYRYLGTIGLFDTVSLHLKAGDNELLFAVSESFGGWGIMARLPE